MTVYHLFIAVCLVAFLTIAALAVKELIADAWAGYRLGANLATRTATIARVNHISAGADANSLDVLLADLLGDSVPQQRGPGRWS